MPLIEVYFSTSDIYHVKQGVGNGWKSFVIGVLKFQFFHLMAIGLVRISMK